MLVGDDFQSKFILIENEETYKMTTTPVIMILEGVEVVMKVLCAVLLFLSSPVLAADFKKPSDAELKKRLTPMQYNVTQKAATEPPFQNEYYNHHEEGLYVDIVSGEPLFSSKDKFDSGTGWPSFTKPVRGAHLVEKKDEELGYPRTELRSRLANSHLGHVFTDGPQPTGLRYCIDSAALKFVPKARLKAEGYGEFLKDFEEPKAAPSKPKEAVIESRKLQTATLAAGCFWGVEEYFRKVDGVVTTEVGYAGGSKTDPTYEQVSSGTTGHAEAVEIKFDPAKISYERLLEMFFKMHDPTTLNAQGNDRGPQYRSAIFYHDDGQKEAAEKMIARVERSHAWKSKITTDVAPAKTFFPAEEGHQKYLKKHPGGYDNHYVRDIRF